MRDAFPVFIVCGALSCGAGPARGHEVIEATVSSPTATVPSAPESAAQAAAASGGAIQLPALYAELFVKGKRWPLAMKFVDGHYDGAAQKHIQSTKKGKASCEVGDVQLMAGGLQAHIDCQGVEDNGVEQPLSGWWFATPRGLFRAGPSKTFDDAQLIVEAVPKVRVEKTETKDEPEFGSKITVNQSGAAWCYESTSWGGDEVWWQICLKPDVGFHTGKWGWSGGSTHETMFEVGSDQSSSAP